MDAVMRDVLRDLARDFIGRASLQSQLSLLEGIRQEQTEYAAYLLVVVAVVWVCVFLCMLCVCLCCKAIKPFLKLACRTTIVVGVLVICLNSPSLGLGIVLGVCLACLLGSIFRSRQGGSVPK